MNETQQQCPPCNSECRQGRDCPERRSEDTDFDDKLDLILVIVASLAGVGAFLAYVLWV